MTAVIVTTQGITLTSTGASVSSIIPADSSNGMPRRIKVTANAVCFVKVGVTTDITATTNDIMVSPGESLRLDVGGCAGIAVISFSGTARLNVVAEELGHWNYVTGDTAIDALAILRRYGADAHVYLPGIGTLSGLAAGNWQDSGLTTPAVVDGPIGAAVDPLGAINASQPTAGFRPVLERGARNLLTYSQDFTNAVWSLIGTGSRTAGIADAPNGQAGTSTRIQTTTASSGIRIYYTSLAAPYTGATWIKSNNGATQTAALRYFNNTSQSVNSISVTTEWQILAAPVTADAGGNFQWDLWSTATTTNLDVLVYRAGLFQGTLTAQQILAEGGIPLTTTAAASNPLAGRYSWACDGVDDRLTLASVPFQMADDFAVIAGARTDAATGTLFGIGFSGANTATIALDIGASNARFFIRDNAGLFPACTGGPNVVGSVNVISGRKIANTKVLRVNGSQVATDSTVMGAATLDMAGIGFLNRLTPANYLSGNAGPVIAIKGTISDSDLLTLERLVSALTPNGPQF